MSNDKDIFLIVSSVAFLSVGLHALYKGLYDYGIAWILLSITSMFVHGAGVGKWIDKLMVYTVIVIGAFYYYGIVKKKRTVNLATIAPPVLFVLCALIYHIYTNINHVWVHLFSIIGHHIIIHYA